MDIKTSISHEEEILYKYIHSLVSPYIKYTVIYDTKKGLDPSMIQVNNEQGEKIIEFCHAYYCGDPLNITVFCESCLNRFKCFTT